MNANKHFIKMATVIGALIVTASGCAPMARPESGAEESHPTTAPAGIEGTVDLDERDSERSIAMQRSVEAASEYTPTLTPPPPPTVVPTSTLQPTQIPTSTSAPTATPTSTPAPTLAPSPTPSPTEAPLREGYALLEIVVAGETINTQVPLEVIDIVSPITDKSEEVAPMVQTCAYSKRGDAVYIDDIPFLTKVGNTWEYNQAIKTTPNLLGLGPALYTIEALPGSNIDPSSLELSYPVNDTDSYEVGGGGIVSNTQTQYVVFSHATRASICVYDRLTKKSLSTAALDLKGNYTVLGSDGLSVVRDFPLAVYGSIFLLGGTLPIRDFNPADGTYNVWAITAVTGAATPDVQVKKIRDNLGMFYNLGGSIVPTAPELGIPGFSSNVLYTMAKD